MSPTPRDSREDNSQPGGEGVTQIHRVVVPVPEPALHPAKSGTRFLPASTTASSLQRSRADFQQPWLGITSGSAGRSPPVLRSSRIASQPALPVPQPCSEPASLVRAVLTFPCL